MTDPPCGWVSVALLSGVLLAPLLIVDVPPLVDYPNHLARLFILAALPDDPVLARFYAPHWAVIPNLAIDLIGLPLLRWLPVHVAGRLLLAGAIVLPVLGTCAYHRAVHGRLHRWGLGVGFMAWNNCLLFGFGNFEIAIGLALLLAAIWLHWCDSRPMLAVPVCAAGAVLLFACHLMGLVFLATLIAGHEISRILGHRSRVRATLHATPVLLCVFAPATILYCVSDLHGMGGDAQWDSFGAKLAQLLDVFSNYCRWLDQTTAALLIAGPAVALALRKGRVPGSAGCSGLILLALFLAAPFAWKGTFLLDTRLAVMLGFLLFAGFAPIGWPRQVTRAVTLLLLVLFAARFAVLSTAWFAHRADLADLRAVLAPVGPGQSLYVVAVGFDEAPAYWADNPRWRRLPASLRSDEHLAALAVIEHRAWWPFLFDNPSQQPIRTRQPYRALAERIGRMPYLRDLPAADLCGFDYLLLQEADAVPDLPPNRFRLRLRQGFAALYEVTSCPPEPH